MQDCDNTKSEAYASDEMECKFGVSKRPVGYICASKFHAEY